MFAVYKPFTDLFFGCCYYRSRYTVLCVVLAPLLNCLGLTTTEFADIYMMTIIAEVGKAVIRLYKKIAETRQTAQHSNSSTVSSYFS